MKIIYLIPPSEWKNSWWETWSEILSFSFEKPLDIAQWASEKDLKCKGLRFEEWIELNKNIQSSEIRQAIQRYTGVMYNAIDYVWMDIVEKKYFEDNFFILSGMYGILSPKDSIWNYKLPIETKGLYAFWWDKITKKINDLQADIVVDFLPNSYKKMIRWDKLHGKVLKIDFFHIKNGERKKVSHWVKKIKGEYIKNLCKNWPTEILDSASISQWVLEIDA